MLTKIKLIFVIALSLSFFSSVGADDDLPIDQKVSKSYIKYKDHNYVVALSEEEGDLSRHLAATEIILDIINDKSVPVSPDKFKVVVLGSFDGKIVFYDFLHVQGSENITCFSYNTHHYILSKDIFKTGEETESNILELDDSTPALENSIILFCLTRIEDVSPDSDEIDI